MKYVHDEEHYNILMSFPGLKITIFFLFIERFFVLAI